MANSIIYIFINGDAYSINPWIPKKFLAVYKAFFNRTELKFDDT